MMFDSLNSKEATSKGLNKQESWAEFNDDQRDVRF